MDSKTFIDRLAIKLIHEKVAQFAWQPEFYTLPDDREAMGNLLNKPGISVFDTLHNQLEELIKSRNVSAKLNADQIQLAITAHLKGINPHEYGLWVFYPWNNNLVHILPREEFIELRTSRNKYKITSAEQNILSTKRVGIIGLSVGQSVAVTMAMERGFGEIRLADFDLLELTNLNRIRTGIHNLGIPKVIAVAREIMEIDPFMQVRPFPEGLMKENMDAFFTDGGKLDLLIDECDGLDIKVLARFKAKELGIPVLMEASDRATVDVERFDLEPKRPILHGLIEDLDPEKLATLKTNDEKVPYMLAIVGLDTISTRAKSSMLEIGNSISTWPQLASAVALGGGITADVARRIFLNQFSKSGRFNIDLDELIGEGQDDFSVPNYSFPNAGEIKTDWIARAKKLAHREIVIAASTVDQILQAAHAAPSGGNLQPWAWVHCGSSFFLFRKTHLSSSFLDTNLMATWVSLGASMENLLLTAQKEGFHAELLTFPEEDNTEWVAQINLSPLIQPTEYEEVNQKLKLYDAVLLRHTNRNIESSKPILASELEFITQSLKPLDLSITYFEAGPEKELLSNCIAAVERIRVLNPEGYRNFMEEIRWTPEEAKLSGDGVDLATCDLSETEIAGFKIARHRKAVELLHQWGLGKGLENLSIKATSSAPILAMIHGAERGRDSYLTAGRALERTWIAANQCGVAFQPQSPITLLIDKIALKNDLASDEFSELKALHEKISSLTSLKHPEPLFIFRLFKGEKPVTYSQRRNPISHLQSNNRND